jgi:DivIVA domain-containing protein
MRRKKEHGEQAQSSGDGRLTPAEIQQVEFRLAFRGYNERDVDAFLDRITEELSSYLDEINRLRSGAGTGASSSQVAAAPVGGSATAGAGTDARAAMAPFLNREREFLQSLGVLVQGHAEEIKAMVLSLRGKVEAEARGGSTPSASGIGGGGSAAPGQPAAKTELENAVPSPPPVTRPEAVVLGDAVEPARAGESEAVSAERPSGERSLRDLFWGED